MNDMFSSPQSFDRDIDAWDVSGVSQLLGDFAGSMFAMLWGATSFNQDIGGWNTVNVRAMVFLFDATAFNQDIGDWDVTGIGQSIDGIHGADLGSMYGMFLGATNFNQNISAWDVSKVIIMANMFKDASAIDQDISAWDVGMVTLCFEFSDNTLPGWTTAEKPNFTGCTQ